MDRVTSISEADEQYLTEIAGDCLVQLGTGAELVSLSQEISQSVVRVRLRYRIGGREHETVASGASLLDAHRALREAILVDRIRFGFNELIARA